MWRQEIDCEWYSVHLCVVLVRVVQLCMPSHSFIQPDKRSEVWNLITPLIHCLEVCPMKTLTLKAGRIEKCDHRGGCHVMFQNPGRKHLVQYLTTEIMRPKLTTIPDPDSRQVSCEGRRSALRQVLCHRIAHQQFQQPNVTSLYWKRAQETQSVTFRKNWSCLLSKLQLECFTMFYNFLLFSLGLDIIYHINSHMQIVLHMVFGDIKIITVPFRAEVLQEANSQDSKCFALSFPQMAEARFLLLLVPPKLLNFRHC